MAQLDVRIDTHELHRQLQGLVLGASSVQMSDVAEELKIAIDDVIQAEGEIAGNSRWDPLEPSTLRRHPRRRGRPLLQNTGVLANIQTRHGPEWAEAYSPAPYAGFHVSGTRHMVSRDFLAIDFEATFSAIADIVLQEIIR